MFIWGFTVCTYSKPLFSLYGVLSCFYSTRRFVLSLAFCYFILVFFSPFSIAITSLGEKGAIRTFVRFALVWFCLFLLSLRVCDGLRLVIVALPGFFSFIFITNNNKKDLKPNDLFITDLDLSSYSCP